jgi:hypothetical protein
VKELSATALTCPAIPQIPGKLILLLIAVHVLALGIFATPEITTSDDQSTVIVNNAPEQEVYAIGKSVIVTKSAKGVLAIGGDVTVEGRIEGDVGAIGGDVIQKDGAYIGGNIIVFGGSYKPETQNAPREPGQETITFGVFEEELRNFGHDPTALFSPSLSISFFAQRLVVSLFWFVVTFVISTLAPGAVSRAVARIQLSSLKVCALGAATFIFISSVMLFGALALPNYFAATIGVLGMLLLVLGFVFGRVALQVSVGKMIQRQFLGENNRSETIAILAGVLAWTVLLSLPYVWLIALFAIFTFGIGLVLTGRTGPKWQNP